MLWLMTTCGLVGLWLFLAAPRLGKILARAIGARTADPGALAHLLRMTGLVLLVTAALVRPHHPEATAFPPPPDRLQERIGR